MSENLKFQKIFDGLENDNRHILGHQFENVFFQLPRKMLRAAVQLHAAGKVLKKVVNFFSSKKYFFLNNNFVIWKFQKKKNFSKIFRKSIHWFQSMNPEIIGVIAIEGRGGIDEEKVIINGAHLHSTQISPPFSSVRITRKCSKVAQSWSEKCLESIIPPLILWKSEIIDFLEKSIIHFLQVQVETFEWWRWREIKKEAVWKKEGEDFWSFWSFWRICKEVIRALIRALIKNQ